MRPKADPASRPPNPRWAAVAAAGGLVGLAGCSSPLAVQGERDLRRSVVESVQRELAQAQKAPALQIVQREPGIERLRLKPELMPEYERLAGPGSYNKTSFPMDADLMGEPQKVVPITLERAIRSAATNNLQLQFARLQPAIAESQVVAAQAAFDFTLFNNFEWSNLDQPRAQTLQGFQTFGTATDQRLTTSNSTGLRRPLTSGGQLTFQQDYTYTDITTFGSTGVPNPANEVDWTLRLEQPLLRGFGSDVALAQVRVNRNAARDSIASLKRDMIRVLTDTERAYWQLVQARWDLLILQRLYERGVKVRDDLVARAETVKDTTSAQVADSRARVERRRSDVLRAQQAFRAASDALKVLINDPDATVGTEDLLIPADDALDVPISFSLADVLANAIRNRPEAQQAILSIDNTAIRQEVADNARLPKLDLRLQSRLAGLRDNVGSAYGDVGDRDFVDYIVGLQFEMPIGNRAAEAAYRQRRSERMQATIAYRNTVQNIVLEAKRALRQVVTQYRLIEQTRTTRVAETENLRSFQVERQFIRGGTAEQLDLEFRRQESLAQAEQAEIGALADYNTALAQLYAAMGTALEHNRIEFRVPDADAPLGAGGLDSKANPVVPVNRPNDGVAPVEPKLVPPWKKNP